MTLDDEVRGQAQKNLTLILKAMQTVSQLHIAKMLGEGTSTISEFKKEHLERLAAMLAACGLKVAPAGQESNDPDEMQALRVLAGKWVNQRRGPDSGFGGL
jgi:hypothetical protein